MNTIIRKYSYALKKVSMTYLINIANRYIKNFGYDKDTILEDIAEHTFKDLNSEYKFIDKDLESTYVNRHIDDILYALTDVFPELDEKIKGLKESKHVSQNNKKLYESIMRDVSKIVKMHLS